MNKKPKLFKQLFKNLTVFSLSFIIFLGPVALILALINQIIFLVPIALIVALINQIIVKCLLFYIARHKKYKIKYDYEQINPFKDKYGDYVIKTQKDLKILQLTDLHIGGGIISLRKDLLAIIAMIKMVVVEKPDLIVVTGDIAFPVIFQAGTLLNLQQQKIMSKIFNTLGVYWTFVFGNHDSEMYSPYTKYHISRWYEKKIKNDENFKYCLYTDIQDDIAGHGNQYIKIINENDELIQNLVLLDSHAYTTSNPFGLGIEYDYLKENQVIWSKEKIKETNKEYNTDCKAIVFLHIPLYEYRAAWREYRTNGNNDVVQLISGKVCKKETRINKYDEKTWGINCSSDNSGLFDALHNEDLLSAVFCGHDHKNDIAIMYKGVLLSYSKPIDYLAYWGLTREKRYRGCNVINVGIDKKISSQIYDYYDPKYENFYVFTHENY